MSFLSEEDQRKVENAINMLTNICDRGTTEVATMSNESSSRTDGSTGGQPTETLTLPTGKLQLSSQLNVVCTLCIVGQGQTVYRLPGRCHGGGNCTLPVY